MKTLTKSIVIMNLVLVMCFASSAVFAGDAGVKIGTLVVTAIPHSGHNLIIKSSSDVRAVFTDASGNKEHYIGEMGVKLGLDISHKTGEKLEYIVFSASSNYKTGGYALQGKYFGQNVSAELVVGGGVQVLLGGFNKSLTLQPLALKGTKGYGVTAGLGYLYLQKDHEM